MKHNNIEKLSFRGSYLENKNNNLIWTTDAFVRSIQINKGIEHSLFLGAGASITSGMPSAQNCIWEWKSSIFVSNFPALKDEVSELSLKSVKTKIQNWLDLQGKYPPENNPEEYSQYIQTCYPRSADRRQYFNSYVTQCNPSSGYKYLSALASENIVTSVWTTNFDNLSSKSATLANLTPIEIGIDSQTRVYRPQQNGELLCVSLHGDYRYDSLKNTSEELVKQEKELFKAAAKKFQSTPLIVIGYSGRDKSIMDALKEAYSEKGTGPLYWCGYGENLTDEVKALLEHVRNSGREAYYIVTSGFDNVLRDLAKVLLSTSKLDSLKIDHQSNEKLTSTRTKFRLPEYPTVNVVKSNAYAINLPEKLFQFSLNNLPEKGIWKHIKGLTEGTNVIAAPIKKKVLAAGTINDIKTIFGKNIEGQVELVPLDLKELALKDGVVTSILSCMFLKSASEQNNLNTDSKKLLWEKSPYETVDQVNRYRAVIISFKVLNGTTYIVLKPSLKLLKTSGEALDLDSERNVKMQVFGYQHNDKFEIQTKHWAQILCGQTYKFASCKENSFVTTLAKNPLFAKIGQNHPKYPLKLEASWQKSLQQSGVLLNDIPIVFSNKSGDEVVEDIHPLRGLLQNRPSDFPLTQSRIAETVNIGVVCPTADSASLEAFLLSLLQSTPVKDERKEDYLLAYPGFQNAYGVSLVLPNKDTGKWVSPAEPDTFLSQLDGLVALANSLISSAERIATLISSPIVIIYIPQRWQFWFDYSDENHNVDLHNYVKAACAQKGIATQLIRWATVNTKETLRVKWWLSLAIYAKSMRTPWRLNCLESDTAYVGLGYSIDSNAIKGQHILMGCSHLYSSKGEGLQFRLNKIDNPIYINKNPFLSEEDARKVGENIKELFFEARMKLPKRVVIHKKTPFIEQERVGLQKGLVGIERIDLIEINVDESLRYVASKFKRDTGLEIDTYPINRGTVIPIDDYSALLWVHGSSIHVSNSSYKYYKGKRRIPAPLIIRRHAGNSELMVICNEILGLSKMNWNSFELYAQLPATLESSSEIAKIGSLLARFTPQSYDYRLFI